MSSEAVKIFAVVFTLQILRRLCLEKMEAHEQRFVTSSKLLFLLQLRAVVSSFLVIVGGANLYVNSVQLHTKRMLS